MNVPNHDKVPFRDMTPEERSAIVEAWIDGRIEYYSNTAWKEKCAGDSIFGGTVYRIKPRQLIIPWEHIKPEYKWAVIDAVLRVYFHRDKPVLHFGAWVSDGSMCNAGALNIDTTGIDWRDSLVQRPEGV